MRVLTCSPCAQCGCAADSAGYAEFVAPSRGAALALGDTYRDAGAFAP
jgi:hypothetical protein